jgi:metal-responsive CopG/Arc/MetJ family transcriptional regulator
LPKDLLDAVDGWAMANGLQRSEAFRRLVESGLANATKLKRRPTKRTP